MPDDVIDRVHRLAKREDAVGIDFRDRTGDIVQDEPGTEGDHDGEFNSGSSGSEEDDDDGDGREDYHMAGVGHHGHDGSQVGHQDSGAGRSEGNHIGGEAAMAEREGDGDDPVAPGPAPEGQDESPGSDDLDERYGPRTGRLHTTSAPGEHPGTTCQNYWRWGRWGLFIQWSRSDRGWPPR